MSVKIQVLQNDLPQPLEMRDPIHEARVIWAPVVPLLLSDLHLLTRADARRNVRQQISIVQEEVEAAGGVAVEQRHHVNMRVARCFEESPWCGIGDSWGGVCEEPPQAHSGHGWR